GRRTLVRGGAQSWKACEGAPLRWVQIPPPPPLTCDDASPPYLLGGGGRRGGLSFGPQMVSVDRAEIPAAGWIGPELRPCTAADIIWEEIPAGPCRGREKPSARQKRPPGRGAASPALRRPPARSRRAPSGPLPVSAFGTSGQAA